jgi:hypothetical protein
VLNVELDRHIRIEPRGEEAGADVILDRPARVSPVAEGLGGVPVEAAVGGLGAPPDAVGGIEGLEVSSGRTHQARSMMLCSLDPFMVSSSPPERVEPIVVMLIGQGGPLLAERLLLLSVLLRGRLL